MIKNIQYTNDNEKHYAIKNTIIINDIQYDNETNWFNVLEANKYEKKHNYSFMCSVSKWDKVHKMNVHNANTEKKYMVFIWKTRNISN